jgi:probable F420-dependent oxidoreductase
LADSDLKFGVVLPSREALMGGDADPELLLDVAKAAERAGFDSVWIGDSMFHRPRFDPLTMLAAVAARTERVSVGTAVLLPALRHPLLLAHSLATVDRISKGRLIAGVGAGWIQEEFDAVGVPFDQRVGRSWETMKICRGAWAADGDLSKLGNRYWSLPPVEILPKPYQLGGPPIWVGGSGPAALRAAGTMFDGWVPTSPDAEAFRMGWEVVVRHAQDAGRDSSSITPAVYLTLNLSDDVEKAEAETAEYAEDYYGLPFMVMQAVQGYQPGPAEQAVEWIQGFIAAGARHFLLRFASLDPMTHLERAAESVLPALRT